jgi:hypothetical protein
MAGGRIDAICMEGVTNDAGELFWNNRPIHQKNMLVFPSATDLQQAFSGKNAQQNSYIRISRIKKDALRSVF